MSFRAVLMLALLVGCPDPAEDPLAFDTDALPDLTLPLGEGQARAGQIHQFEVLIGGPSAEGREGDFLIENAVARFIVQGKGVSHHYNQFAGAVIDADIPRPAGAPGADILDDHFPAFDLGIVLRAKAFEILDDGSGSGTAHLQVRGDGGPLELLAGAIESETHLRVPELRFTTDYILPADSPLLQMTTTVHWDDPNPTSRAPMDVLMYAGEVAAPYTPGGGLASNGNSSDGGWMGLVGHDHRIAVALLAGPDGFVDSSVGDLLFEVGTLLTGTAPTVDVASSASVTYTRYLGVSDDLGDITSAWHAMGDAPTETLSGTLADGVGGVRVHLLDAAGDPVAMTLSDADGSWSAVVPQGQVTQVALDANPSGLFLDLADDHGWAGPYTPGSHTLSSYGDGSTPPPLPSVVGVAGPVPLAEADALTLQPAFPLTLQIPDGVPTVFEVARQGESVPRDPRWMRPLPEGFQAVAVNRDGQLRLPLPAGDFTVHARRGFRGTPVSMSVTLDQSTPDLVVPTFDTWQVPDGFVAGDPHSHSLPSPDGRTPMESRLLVSAAMGLDLHFGTDHDHHADYRPTLEALGLQGRLQSIHATEFSPPTRGHYNLWPLQPDRQQVNGGATRWWSRFTEWTNTDEMIALARRSLASDGVMSVNHGRSGMFSFASYDPADGSIGRPDHWTDRFEAMEVLNRNHGEELPADFRDLTARGHEVAPLGVSDAHGLFGPGEAFTWFLVDDPSADDLSEGVVAATRRQATVASTGPLLTVFTGDDWAGGATLEGGRHTLTVDVHGPAWLTSGTLTRTRIGPDGEQVFTDALDLAGGPWTFELVSADDEVWFFEFESADPRPYKAPTPWAMTAGVRIDVQGDGWTPPLEPLTRQ